MLLQSLFIELWSNGNKSAFAVKLSSDQENCFRATMQQRNNDKFIEIADVMYYDESSHYDWSFMLEKWIEAWKSGFRHSSSIPEFQRLYFADRSILEQKPCDNITTIIPTSDSDTKRKRKLKKNDNINRKKPTLKCHYCNLIFHEANKRSAHEETWHADKLLKSNINNTSLKLARDMSSREVKNNG